MNDKEFKFKKEFVQERQPDLLIDVGAKDGRLGKEAPEDTFVHFFEPSDNYYNLEDVVDNGVFGKASNMAISNFNGDATINRKPNGDFCSMASGGPTEAKFKKLSCMFHPEMLEIQDVMVSINVAGMETMVVEGMWNIHKEVDSVLVEYHPDNNAMIEECAQTIRDMGFTEEDDVGRVFSYTKE